MRRAAVSTMLLTGVSAALLSLGMAGAQMAPPADMPMARPRIPEPMPVVGTYTGVSTSGNFQEAMDDAVTRAMRSSTGQEGAIRYRVTDITGEQTGLQGPGVLRVTIALAMDDATHRMAGR